MSNKRLVKALMNHLETKLTQLAGQERTVNPADPTSLATYDGFVSFDYDPWADPEEVLLYAAPPSRTYAIHVEQMWGTKVVLTRRGSYRVHTQLYVDEGANLASLDDQPRNIEDQHISWLENLLMGDFGKTVEEAETPVGPAYADHW